MSESDKIINPVTQLLNQFSSTNLTYDDVHFFNNFLKTNRYLFIYKGETLLQLLIRENKNIRYIMILLYNLLSIEKNYDTMINHYDPNGLTAFIQIVIYRPNHVKDVIRIFMSFESFDKKITYNGKTAEDYIKESPLSQKKKDNLLKILNPTLKRKRTETYMENGGFYGATIALLKLSKK